MVVLLMDVFEQVVGAVQLIGACWEDLTAFSICFFQLRGEVGCLQGELEGKRSEMETLDTLLQRRERENHEGGNLLNMLTEDLQTAKEER